MMRVVYEPLWAEIVHLICPLVGYADLTDLEILLEHSWPRLMTNKRVLGNLDIWHIFHVESIYATSDVKYIWIYHSSLSFMQHLWPGACCWCTQLKITHSLALVNLFKIRSRWYLARSWHLWISSHWKSLCLPIGLNKREYSKNAV